MSLLALDIEAWAEHTVKEARRSWGGSAAQATADSVKRALAQCAGACQKGSRLLAGAKQQPDSMTAADAAKETQELEACYQQCSASHLVQQ